MNRFERFMTNGLIYKFSKIDLMLDIAREKLINHEKRIKKLEKP